MLAEILSPDRSRRILWVAVTHLKSQFVDWRIKDEAERQKATEEAARVRRLEAEMTARILKTCTNEEPYVLCGDFNDVPESPALEPLLGENGGRLGLVNVLVEHQSDPLARWTITHKETGQDRRYDQYDYLLVPPFVAKRVEKAWVERRGTRPAEPDGSDHDLVMCEMAVAG